MNDTFKDVCTAIEELATIDLAKVETAVVGTGTMLITIAHVGDSKLLSGSLIRILREKGIVVVEDTVPNGYELTIDYPCAPEPLAPFYPKKTAPWGKKQRFGPGGEAFTRAQKKGR